MDETFLCRPSSREKVNNTHPSENTTRFEDSGRPKTISVQGYLKGVLDMGYLVEITLRPIGINGVPV